MQQAIMHCHDELEKELGYKDFLPDVLLMKWVNDRYSTSKHLLTLYTIARGLNAQTILEIGFGRSSFVLARAAQENGGRFITCDIRDFRYLLSDAEKQSVMYILGNVADLWQKVDGGIDLAFLDYFGADHWTVPGCIATIEKALAAMKTNGIIAIHDTLTEKYAIHQAVKDIACRSDIEVITMPFNYGLTLIRYIGPSRYGCITDMFFKKNDPQLR